MVSEDRRMLPVLIVNLDGAMGYWDTTHYVLRPKIVDSLIHLSFDFRLVAVSTDSQKNIFKLIFGLMNVPSDNNCADEARHLVFDAVYQLNS